MYIFYLFFVVVYTKDNSYLFLIYIAFDMFFSFFRNATLSITIETVERHNISFATGRYEMSVEESAFAGETVGVVTAKPLRREDSTRIRFGS